MRTASEIAGLLNTWTASHMTPRMDDDALDDLFWGAVDVVKVLPEYDPNARSEEDAVVLVDGALVRFDRETHLWAAEEE